MNEWEFTALAAGWINEVLHREPRLPFSEARCEQTRQGSRKRRDLTLLDKAGRRILTGEVKLPYQRDGGSPLNASVVQDARAKARRARVEYFFTWNVNDFALWQTDAPSGPWEDRNYKAWPVVHVRNADDLERASTHKDIRKWLEKFLADFAQIVLGAAQIGTKAPDEKFIELLESSLRTPILLVFDELERQYQGKAFKRDLDDWMRDEQNWLIVDDPEGVRDNLERAAKFACYSLVNKLVFHEALLRPYGQRMRKLSVPEHIATGEQLRMHIEGEFVNAKRATRDYETVFGEEHAGMGNRLPFCSDAAVPPWRELIGQIHQYDFTALDHEVIGSIFERLIGPYERKKYGQFYTRVEVVDLINSFAIRTGDEKVMDPGCGAGTFLVRAYGRKKELAPQRSHTELLTDLYGVDVARYATEWTTINLATRELVEEENYPRVVHKDFFDVAPHTTALSLPKRAHTKGLGKLHHQEIEIPPLDAVVGNLPYVRQEKIRKNKNGAKQPAKGTKEYYLQLAKTEGNIKFSGRSDLHCYFWPHAATFLKDDGYLCFLTSSQWLDVEYGFRLQEWILRNYEIIALFESIDEPWFVGARVATTVTILRRQPDELKRMENMVRFVQLRKPIRELAAPADHTMAAAVRATDAFRDEILTLTENTHNDRYRARLVPQRTLWEDGVRLAQLMRKSDNEDDEDAQTGEYYGGKWGVHLRAPDLWFDILDDYGDKLVPLGDVAEIRRGITSGNDAFFFPIDASEECLQTYKNAREFESEYGVPRKDVASGKVKLVRCGEGRGEIRPIEAEFLEPEVHTLMEVDKFVVTARDCKRLVLLVAESRNNLRHKYIKSYVEWGEREGFDKRSTCASRASEHRAWYDLTGHRRGCFLWPMTQKYKHVIPHNQDNLICNHRLFDVFVDRADLGVLGGILNSSLVVLSKHNYGRYIGTEGTLDTEVIDVNMMLVPDPRKGTLASQKRVAVAFKKMKKRKVLQLLSEKRLREAALTAAGKTEELAQLSDLSELDMEDRQELDDAVLELVGVKSKSKRAAILQELYSALRELFERNRKIEEQANLNKILSKHRGAARPEDTAAQVFEEIVQTHPEFLRRYEGDFLDPRKPFDTYEVPLDGEPVYEADMLSDSAVTFIKGTRKRAARIETNNAAQARLLALAAKSGLRSFVRVPHEDKECHRLRREYEAFVLEREQTVRHLINQRTSDEDLQEKIYGALMPMLLNGRK